MATATVAKKIDTVGTKDNSVPEGVTAKKPKTGPPKWGMLKKQ